MSYPDETWISWIDRLAANDYAVVDDFIPDALFRDVMDLMAEKEQEDQLKKAGIGTLGKFQVEASIRGDFIYWLDRQRDVQIAAFFELMDEMKEKLNRFCFLSLSGSEFHLAKYPAGSFYKRHLDQFQERSNRQITVLIYLNEHWKKADGGELGIYKENTRVLVEPVARRLLFFRSDTIEHEVLPTLVPRYSLTGWFLHQPASVGYLIQ